GAVVENAAVRRPGPSPSVSIEVLRGTLPGAVPPGLGEDPGVDPRSAGRGAIGLQLAVARDQLPVGDGVAVDLLQDLFGHRLVERTLGAVVEGQGAKAVVPGPWVALRLPLQASGGVEDKVVLAPAVTGGIGALLPPLQQPLCGGEGAVLLCVTRRRHQDDLGG